MPLLARPKWKGPLPDPPQGLTPIPGAGNDPEGQPIRLARVALPDLLKLQAAAQAAGLQPPRLNVVSGYRSKARQTPLWQAALAKYGSPEKARKWVAPPGYSTHETGLAVDFKLDPQIANSSTNAKNGSLATTAAYTWLVANAWRYNFAPYANEPWHWEYAGPDYMDAITGAGGAGAAAGGMASGPGAAPSASSGGFMKVVMALGGLAAIAGIVRLVLRRLR